jgi:hypothetical protein
MGRNNKNTQKKKKKKIEGKTYKTNKTHKTINYNTIKGNKYKANSNDTMKQQ